MSPDSIIEKLGGTNQAATLCEVSKSAVSQWKKTGIPKARLMFLKAVRPEIFHASDEAQKAEAA
jgi:hypothetical protein